MASKHSNGSTVGAGPLLCCSKIRTSWVLKEQARGLSTRLGTHPPVCSGSRLTFDLPPRRHLQPADEAGRGPVLGPMVYACAFAPIATAEALKKKAFADSKTLTAEKRDDLFEAIKKDSDIGYMIDSIPATYISGGMLSRQRVSLNAMAFDSTCKLISRALDMGVNLQEVYVDTVGDADNYKKRLSQQFPGLQFTVCPKADALFPIVSAASIVAKVTRDKSMEAYKEDGTAYGSGYPGDPDTKAYMESNIEPTFGYPDLVRFSWSTAAQLLEKNACAVEWEAEVEGDTTQQSLASMMGGGSVDKSIQPLKNRHSYFRARKLQKVVSAW